jgi:hypothetical protein
MAILAFAVVMVAVGFAGTTRAAADVCAGGFPYEAGHSPEARVTSLVPFLGSPRWSKEMLPPASAERNVTSWSSELAYAWYGYTRLWAATSSATWWVVPGLGCDLKNEPELPYGKYALEYPAEVCVLVYVQLSMESSNCEDKLELSSDTPPVEAEHGVHRLLSGYAPAGTRSVEVQFAAASVTLPVVGGVYGGSVDASLGKATSVKDLEAQMARTPAPVVLVDQTGIFGPALGALASVPRMKRVAARIHARIPSIRALDLGDCVKGRLAQDTVLYVRGSRRLATRVARALRARKPRPLAAGELEMFGPVAQVVVLVGHTD